MFPILFRRRKKKVPFATKVAALSPYVWWKLNETSGTTITNSGSGGSGYNATLTLGSGALGAAGIGDGGTSILFDGSVTWITNGAFTAPAAAVMDTGTLILWCKFASGTWADGVSHNSRIDRTTGANYVLIGKSNSNALTGQRSGGGVTGGALGFAPNTTTDWFIHALTWSVSNNRATVYQVLKGGGTVLSATGTSGGAWTLGTALWHIGYAGAYYKGHAAHFILFPSELTQAQLVDLAKV